MAGETAQQSGAIGELRGQLRGVERAIEAVAKEAREREERLLTAIDAQARRHHERMNELQRNFGDDWKATRDTNAAVLKQGVLIEHLTAEMDEIKPKVARLDSVANRAWGFMAAVGVLAGGAGAAAGKLLSVFKGG